MSRVLSKSTTALITFLFLSLSSLEHSSLVPKLLFVCVFVFFLPVVFLPLSFSLYNDTRTILSVTALTSLQKWNMTCSSNFMCNIKKNDKKKRKLGLHDTSSAAGRHKARRWFWWLKRGWHLAPAIISNYFRKQLINETKALSDLDLIRMLVFKSGFLLRDADFSEIFFLFIIITFLPHTKIIYIYIYNFLNSWTMFCFCFFWFFNSTSGNLFNLISPLFPPTPHSCIVGNGHLFKYSTFKRSF